MNTPDTSPALFRSLTVYAVCVVLAIFVGFSLANLSNTNFRDTQSLILVSVLATLLVFPLLMKWHYPLLIFSWSCPITLFFLPGHPDLFLPMVLISLSISVVERILNKERSFLPAASVRWPLLALFGVVILTAELTGGFGFRSFGSDVYGGKKYATLIIGILSFFAITARPIPKEKANLYILLYFAGTFVFFISDFFPFVPGPLQFIYLIFPVDDRGMDKYGNIIIDFGVTRMTGVAVTASGIFFWMLARYGIRDIFLGGKPWRPILLALAFVLIFLGGFRSNILNALLVGGTIFVLEKMHRSILMLPMLLIGLTIGIALVPLAPHLPYTFQRALAFLPLNINQDAKMDAEGSTEWRLDMWQALLPEVPKYLLLGKGYAFSAETYNEFMGRGATFKAFDEAENPLALSSDFHSGPFSVVLTFGIWGVLAWLWYWAAGFWVVWRNYRYGDPAIRHLNLFLFAFFICKCLSFLFIFGGIVEDVAGFAGVIGLSIAMNHGVCQRQSQLQTNPRINTRPSLALPARPAFQR